MAREWYLSASDDYLSGFENEEFTLNATLAFEEILNNSPESYVVKFNDTDVKVILQGTSDSEQRKMLSRIGMFKRGDLITHKGFEWLVIDYVDDNKMHQSTRIQLCNYTLKWQRDCRIITSPSIVFNRTSNRDDLSADRTMVLTTGQYHVYVQDNEDTRKLKIEDRFFLNNDVYKIAHIDDVTTIGLLTLTVNKDEFNSNIDNRELGISNYVDCPEVTPPIEDNTPVTPSTYEIIIEGTTTITQNQSKSYTAKIVENGIEISGVVTWAVDNANAQITSVDGNSCTVKGLKTGTSQLTAEWNGHATTFNVTIKSLW